MGKLGILDLLSFAKAGYTPKDVRELLEMDVPEPINPEPITPPEQEKATENTPKEDVQVEPSQDGLPSDDIDYKKLYEESEAKLQKLQQENTKKEISNIPVDDGMKAVDDFLKSLM